MRFYIQRARKTHRRLENAEATIAVESGPISARIILTGPSPLGLQALDVANSCERQEAIVSARHREHTLSHIYGISWPELPIRRTC